MYVLVFSSDANCRRFCVDNLVIRGYLAAGLASPKEAALLLQNTQPGLIVVCTSSDEARDHQMIRDIRNVQRFTSVPLLLMGPHIPDPDLMDELGIDAYIPEGRNVSGFIGVVERLLKSKQEQA